MALPPTSQFTTKNAPELGFVSLTFDDGWKCIFENGVPILQRFGMKATFYVISGYLDAFQYPQYMNEEDIRALHRAGHEIGCHTVSHRHLPQEPYPLIEAEVTRSRDYLSNMGFPVDTFAYPYGEYDDRTIEIVRRSGFFAARSTIPGLNLPGTDPLLLQVQAVKAGTTIQEVRQWIEAAKSENAWLILMFHQIDHEGREWSATPEMLQAVVDCVRESGLRTATVREGAEIMPSVA